MLECKFLLDLPVCSTETDEKLFLQVAKLNFDPGLQTGDEISFQDVSINNLINIATGKRTAIDKLKFTAIVLKRGYLIKSVHKNDNSDDIFVLNIFIEMAEKEKVEDLVSDLTSRYPDTYKRQSVVIES
jgi:hypothetical protein